MNPEYRDKLLAVLAKLDQLTADADGILAEPIVDPADHAKAEAVVGLLKQMRANVKAELDRGD